MSSQPAAAGQRLLTELLKRETRAQHEAIERLLPLPAIPAEHVARLAAWFGFIAPWERALAAALPEDDPIRAGRAKTGWLEQDLEFFGLDAERRSRLPRATDLPSSASREEILGAAYVLEGSTLGGQMIARHLETALGLHDGYGYRYFVGYGAATGARWQAFRDELARASAPAVDAVIVSAARATFSILHRWFASTTFCP